MRLHLTTSAWLQSKPTIGQQWLSRQGYHNLHYLDTSSYRKSGYGNEEVNPIYQVLHITFCLALTLSRLQEVGRAHRILKPRPQESDPRQLLLKYTGPGEGTDSASQERTTLCYNSARMSVLLVYTSKVMNQRQAFSNIIKTQRDHKKQSQLVCQAARGK